MELTGVQGEPVWIVNGTLSTVTDGKVSSVITTGNPSSADVLKRIKTISINLLTNVVL